METPERIEQVARSLIQAQQTSLGTEVTTHVVYPNGEQVRAIVSCEGNGFEISDGSFASIYLANEGFKLSSAQYDRAKSAVEHYGCVYKRGVVSLRCGLDSLADSIALVANASRALADFGLDARRATDGDFRLSVIDRLTKSVGEKRLRPREPVAGISGRSYRVGSVVLDRAAVRAVAFVEAFASRATVGDRFAEFYDLHRAHEDVLLLSVYDDALKWPEADLRLLAQVSSVIAYSASADRFGGLA